MTGSPRLASTTSREQRFVYVKRIGLSLKTRAGTVVLVTLIVLVVLYSWALTGRFFDIMQSAYGCAAAQVNQGLDLYTDTVAVHTPLSILFLALLFSWSGVSLNVSTLATRLAAGLESVWIYLFARKLQMSTGWAFVGGLFTLIWGIELGVLGCTPSGYVCLGAFFATGALFFAGAFTAPIFTLLGGVLAGAAFWTYQASGTHIVLAFLVWIGLRVLGVIPGDTRPRLRKAAQELLLFVVGLAGCSLLVFIWAQHNGIWAAMIHYTKDVPRQSVGCYLWQWSALADNLIPDSLSLSYLKGYVVSLSPHPFAAVAWLLLTTSWVRQRSKLGRVIASRVGLVLAFSGVGMLMMVWHPVTYRLLAHVMPALGLAACWWISQRTQRAATAVRRYWPVVLLVLFLLWGVVRIGHNLSWRGNTRIEFPTATFWTTPEDGAWLQQAVATVHKNHPPGSSCFILGRGGLLHILTQTWPAGSYPNTGSIVLNSEEYRRAWIEIARSDPTYVYGFLRDAHYIHNEPYSQSFTSNFDKRYQVNSCITSHAGTFMVWKRIKEAQE